MDTLLAKAGSYLPKDKVAMVADAYRFAEQAHDGQTRLSGEPYIQHPLETALFLADLRLDATALAAALLHDVLEDCEVDADALEDAFGSDVAKLVDGVTKLTKTELMPDGRSPLRDTDSQKTLAEAETLRKMLMTMAEDIRVVLIKLADRLHNMRTLDPLPVERRVAIARETLEIYAPLAHRLGIWELKWRLEDLAFQHLNSEVYRDISKMLSSRRAEREDYIERVRALPAGWIWTTRASRPPSPVGPSTSNSIYKKIQAYADHNKEVGEIYDLFALRRTGRRRQGLLRGAGRRPQQVAPPAGAVRRLHREPQGQPVPVACTRPFCARMPTRSRSRSGPAICTTWPNTGSPPTGCTRKARPRTPGSTRR